MWDIEELLAKLREQQEAKLEFMRRNVTKWHEYPEDPSKSLNEKLSQYCGKEINGIEPIKEITLVGAEHNRDIKGQAALSEDDFKYLENTLKNLHAAGVPIAKDFKVDVVNIIEDRNFANENKKTDLVIFCNLPPHAHISIPDWNRDTWERKIEESGAKIVATAGYGGSNNKNHFSEDILDKNDHLKTVLSKGYEEYKSITVTMTTDYISSIAPRLDKETELGKNAQVQHRKILAEKNLIGTREAYSPPLPPRK